MLWDLFLMKKFLKNVISGSVNSTWKYCSRKTWSTTAAWKKEKRKENAERKNMAAQTWNPNMYKETNHTNFSMIFYYFHVKYGYFYHIFRLCLVTIFIFYFQKLFWEYKEKIIFLYFWIQKYIWLVEIKKIVFWRKKKEKYVVIRIWTLMLTH